MPFITIALALAVMGLFASAICERWASPQTYKIVGMTFFLLIFGAVLIAALTI